MEESKVVIVEAARVSITSIKTKDRIVKEVEEPRATSLSCIFNEITQLEKKQKTTEVIIDQDNLDIFLSRLVESLSSITPDHKHTHSQK